MIRIRETSIDMFITYIHRHRNLETRKHLRLLSSGMKLFFYLLSLTKPKGIKRNPLAIILQFFHPVLVAGVLA